MSKKSGIAALVISIAALCLSIVNLCTAPKAGKQEAPDIQYVMYLGTMLMYGKEASNRKQ